MKNYEVRYKSNGKVKDRLQNVTEVYGNTAVMPAGNGVVSVTYSDDTKFVEVDAAGEGA